MTVAAVFIVLVFLYSLVSRRLEQTAVMAPVMLSIFAHGFSALPGISRYARTVATLDATTLEKRE